MLIDAPLGGARDRLLAMRAIPSFSGLPDASLRFAAEHARDRRFRRAEALFAESAPLTHLHFLVHGRVRTSRRGAPHQVLEAPGAVGVLAALAREAEGWGAVAEEDTLTLEVPIGAYLENLEEDFALLRNSLRTLADATLALAGDLPFAPGSAPAVSLGPPVLREPTVAELVIAFHTGARAQSFEHANLDALFELARRMRLRRLAPGEVLFERGTPGASSFRVLHGRVRCTAASGEHVDVGAGVTLGVLDGFASRPRSYDAHAVTEVVGHTMLLEEALAVFEMYPRLSLSTLRDLARRLVLR